MLYSVIMWQGFIFKTPFLTFIYLYVGLVNYWHSLGHISESSGSRNTSRHLGSPSVQSFIHPRLIYSASRLKALRKLQPKQHLSKDLWLKLGDLGVRKKFRSKRGGKERSSPHGLPVVDNNIGLSQLNLTPAPSTAPEDLVQQCIPSLLIGNLRSLAPKVDEFDSVIRHNGCDIVSVTETWLKSNIPDSAVSLHDYVLFRKDRQNRCGGGVALFVSSTTYCKRLPEIELNGSLTETLWVHLRPRRLPRSVSCILVGVVYHPPEATSSDNDVLYNHIQQTVDEYSLKHPDCLVWISGDFNPSSTNFSAAVVKRMCGLTQSVKVLTRDTGILDWLLTNRPSLTSDPVQLPKIGRSDHYCILVKRHVDKPTLEPHKHTVTRRDMRPSRLREFGRWITSHLWTEFYSAHSCQDKFEIFQHTITDALDRFCPVQVSRIHRSDKPWMTSKIKSWIAKRQRMLGRFGSHSNGYRLWRNKVANAISTCKHSLYTNKVKNLKNTNIPRWWSEIKNLSGVSAREGQWYAQLCDDHHIDGIETLCCEINEFFTGLTSNFIPLMSEDVSAIFVPDAPESLLVSPPEAFKAPRGLKTNKAPGPDHIPSLILKMFAFELSPVLAELYNSSLKQGFLPSLLKSAVVCPLPKQRPPKSIECDVRPISLTCHTAKIMEGFTLSRVLPGITESLDPMQFAMAGKSTQHAIVYLLHLTLEALDKGNCWVRWFFADFKKGFDLVDHRILLEKLKLLDVHPCLLRWIAAFL